MQKCDFGIGFACKIEGLAEGDLGLVAEIDGYDDVFCSLGHKVLGN